MPSVISGDANVSATEFGYLDGVTSALQTQIDAKLNLAGGKILQIVRATDSTGRSTTSTSFVDGSISVTITPQKSDSAVLLIWIVNGQAPTGEFLRLQITDNSNNAISGAENTNMGSTGTTLTSCVLVGYSTPATTSATTYKGRFLSNFGGSVELRNNLTTGQLYAIEVSA